MFAGNKHLRVEYVLNFVHFSEFVPQVDPHLEDDVVEFEHVRLHVDEVGGVLLGDLQILVYYLPRVWVLSCRHIHIRNRPDRGFRYRAGSVALIRPAG